MKFVRRWTMRIFAWLVFTVAVVNIGGEIILFGLSVYKTGGSPEPIALYGDSIARAITATAFLIIWYYWKDAE